MMGSVVSVLATSAANFGQSSPLMVSLMALDVWKESSGVKLQDLEANLTGPNRETRRSPNVSFKNRLWNELCDMLRRLVETTTPDIMIVQFRNEKLVIMALYRSPLTVTLWPSSFLKKDSTSP
ncbi:hypothetical protein TNCV_4370941 [Trichonephila clavipes]|nr:hypothetical protein TNCV_4370941 [Trichonephila clavipes]